jgi:hypothetical protein
MARSLFDQETQVHASRTYTDSTSPSLANFETNPTELQTDLNNLRSLALYYKNRQASGNWYDVLATPTTFTGEGEGPRAIDDLNQDLHDIERKRILRRHAVVGADIVVPSGVAATGTLTLTGNAANTETVTIDTKTYTFQTVLTDVDGNVLIGATASDSIDNLIAAITLGAGSGTLYAASTTVHPTVTAAAGAGDTMDATAKVQGTAGNTIATTETLGSGSWGGATLSGGAGDLVILGSGELPANTTAAIGSVTTLGTVVAYEASFGTATLTEVTGADALTPKNLVKIANATTGDVITDGSGNEIHALIQSESNTDGSTITATTPNRVQFSFVVHNATNDDLELVDGQYIAGQTIDYSAVERYAFDAIPEEAWLGPDFTDVGASSANRQSAYDNQGITPVDLTTHAYLDLEGAGLTWNIRDDNEATLFRVVEGSGGGTSEVEVGSDVDLYDNNAADVDFSAGASINSGGTRPIDVGVTDGVVESTAGDREVEAAAELILSDGNESAGWSRNGILLSDTSTEWDNFESEFGEVSLLSAIVQAKQSTERETAWANVNQNISANTLIDGSGGTPNITAQMPSYKGLTFVTAVEVFINGQKQRPGADAAANNDVYPSAVGAEQAVGAFYAEYDLFYRGGTNPDVVNMVVFGQPDP